MTKKIIQKVCGFAMSAAMMLSGMAGPVADAWAEDAVALAGVGAEENPQPARGDSDPVSNHAPLDGTPDYGTGDRSYLYSGSGHAH